METSELKKIWNMEYAGQETIDRPKPGKGEYLRDYHQRGKWHHQ